MTTEFQHEQKERRQTLRNDQKVREQPQASTMHQHAVAQADEISQGRFRATGTPSVTGSTPIPQYPQASAPFQCDPVPAEPPLGYSINDLTLHELEPSMAHLPVDQAQAGEPISSALPVDPLPTGKQQAGVGSPPLSRDQTNE
jgi:hypothetical protein